MQEYYITTAGRAQRYRRKKAGKEVGPSIRKMHAEYVKQVAERTNVSTRTINRYLRKKAIEEYQASLLETCVPESDGEKSSPG
jgi:transcriptional regulator with XRE-family HTH domain